MKLESECKRARARAGFDLEMFDSSVLLSASFRQKSTIQLHTFFDTNKFQFQSRALYNDTSLRNPFETLLFVCDRTSDFKSVLVCICRHAYILGFSGWMNETKEKTTQQSKRTKSNSSSSSGSNSFRRSCDGMILKYTRNEKKGQMNFGNATKCHDHQYYNLNVNLLFQVECHRIFCISTQSSTYCSSLWSFRNCKRAR